VRAVCCIAHAFRAAINLHNVVTRDVQRGHERDDGPGHSKAVGHPKSEITKSAFYQNLVTRPRVQNFL